MLEFGLVIALIVFFVAAFKWNRSWVMKQNAGDFPQTKAIWEAMTNPDRASELTGSATEALQKALNQVALSRTLKMTAVVAAVFVTIYVTRLLGGI